MGAGNPRQCGQVRTDLQVQWYLRCTSKNYWLLLGIISCAICIVKPCTIQYFVIAELYTTTTTTTITTCNYYYYNKNIKNTKIQKYKTTKFEKLQNVDKDEILVSYILTTK